MYRTEASIIRILLWFDVVSLKLASFTNSLMSIWLDSHESVSSFTSDFMLKGSIPVTSGSNWNI